jgi:hypothetical protein
MQLTVYRARWVLPVSSPPIRDGAVMVDEDGRIAAVAPAAALQLPERAAVEDLGEAALLPGLVNVHAHPELAMFRGALEDLPFRDWILRLVGAKRAVLEDAELRSQPDPELFQWAAERGRRIVTENIKDFRPLLVHAYTTCEPAASLLLVSPRRFPRGTGERTQAIVKALDAWLGQPDADERPDEDWLV